MHQDGFVVPQGYLSADEMDEDDDDLRTCPLSPLFIMLISNVYATAAAGCNHAELQRKSMPERADLARLVRPSHLPHSLQVLR